MAEHAVIDQAGEAVEFVEAILERRRRQQHLLAILQSPFDGLSQLIAALEDVAQFVRFVNHRKMPANLPDFSPHAVGVLVGGNDDRVFALKRVKHARPLHIRRRLGIQHHGGEIELFLKLRLPLLTQRCRADNEEVALAFRP